MASVIALVSTGTIVLILARALRAINPETEAEVQREYQRAAVALAARDELIELEALRIMAAANWSCTFMVTYPGPGLTIAVAGPGQGTVRDVSVWKLRLLKKAASFRHRSEPIVRAWPGKPVSARTPLMTVDPSTSWLEHWWARRCIRTRANRSDQLGNALTALHGETLEHIRAGRPAEAINGMRALGSLQELLWQAYEAHGRTYGREADRSVVLFRQGAGERIGDLLDDLLRAAAVSTDDAVRREASARPRVIARDAMYREESGTVRQILRQLEGVYIAVVSELSEGGRRDLPLTGLARSRLHAPFRSLLSFVNYHLAQAIDQAAAGSTTGWDGTPLPPTEFLLAHLQAANEAMLQMLRRAVQFRDSATVRRVLDAWKMPDLPLARNAIQEAEGNGTAPVGSTGKAVTAQVLAQSLSDAEADLDAMLLRLLATALDADRAAQREASLPASHQPGGAGTGHDGGVPGSDLATDTILARLPKGRLWDILDRAIQTSEGDWTWQSSDEEIVPAGVVVTRPVDTLSPLIEAFTLATIACPGLVAGTAPGRQFALDRGAALITAVDQALASQMPWLVRQGCTQDSAVSNASDLKTRLKQAVQDARRELEEEIRRSPVRRTAADEVRQAAFAAFRERDITGALFAWAGRLVTGTGLQPTTVTLTASRSHFTATSDGKWAMHSHGKQLGRNLAAQAAGELMLTAAQVGEKRTVRREDIAAAVRDTIAELSNTASAGVGQPAPAARISVFIPDIPYSLRSDLEVEGTLQHDGQVARSRVIRELGLNEEGLAAQVAGAIDGAPVILVSALVGQVLVIDLARFGELQRDASGGTRPAEPDLRLIEPNDPLRPPLGMAVGPVHAITNQLGLLDVQLTLGLSANIALDDPSAARVLRIG